MGFLKNFYLKHMVQWFCDNCGAHLNRQENFSAKTGRWECSKCSYNNDVTSDYVGKGNKLLHGNGIIRENTECKFDGIISYDKFTLLADSIAKKIKRLEVKVEGTFITGTVSTVSGIDTWDFKVDFNDFGNITGKYWWLYCENDDSSIPDAFIKKMVKLINEEIQSSLHENSTLSNEVNNDVDRMIEKQLETFNEEQKIMANTIIYVAVNDIKDPTEIQDYVNREYNSSVGEDKTLQEIYDSLNEEQKVALDTATGIALENKSDNIQKNDLTLDEVIDTFNIEQKIMLYKIIETAIKYPEMESFDEFFNRVSGYDVGGDRIIKEVYRTLDELQKLALTQYVEYMFESSDEDNKE